MGACNKLQWLTLMLAFSFTPYQCLRASDFTFGGFADYSGTETINKDWYDSAGFNSIAIHVDTPGTPGSGLDLLAARNWKVLASLEGQADTAYYQSWPLYAGLHSHLIHWQAEDTGSVPLYNSGVTTCVCAQGELTGQYWHIVPGAHPVTPGAADWQLREHYQQRDLNYTAIFYMKIGSIGNPGDTVARISVVDTIPDTQSRIIIVDSMLRAGDFQGNGVLTPITISYRFGDSPGPWNSNIAVDWWGTRELWLDSAVIYNSVGSELVREDPSALRDSVRQQALRYAQTFLPGTSTPALQWWHGEENFYSFDGVRHGYPYVDNLEVAAYLDSLLSDEYGQGFMCDRNLTEPLAYVGFDSIYLSRAWPQHRNYMMWCYSFTHHDVLAPDSANLLDVQARFDTVAQALEYSRSLTERFNADLHYVAQAWGQTSAGLGDSLRPTQSELKCLSFLGLAFAVDGLWYWPYDSGGDLYRGLLLGGDGGPWRRRHKYYTVQNYVSPIVSRFAETLQGLQRRGTGRLDTLLSTNWNPVSGMVSQPMTDPYVEAGVFEDASSLANYLVLVNRNTSTTSSRQLTLTIDPARLLAPGEAHYYVIDLNPSYSGQEQDTLLAGPIAGEIRYSTVIDPGGIKLLKIAPAPDLIAGTSFPIRWWGAIHAVEGLTVPSTRRLRIEAGSQISVHSLCGYGDTSPAEFKVEGGLCAIGTPESTVVFDLVYDGPPPPPGCSDNDPTRWGGLRFGANAAPCTLVYCNIRNAATPISSINTSLLLESLTTTNTSFQACYFAGASPTFVEMYGCRFDNNVLLSGGIVNVEDLTVIGATVGLQVQSGASATIRGLTDSSFTVQGVSLLSGATLNLEDALLVGSVGSIGLFIDNATAIMDSVTVVQTDTCIVADPKTGGVVRATRLRTYLTTKGVAVRSGELRLDSCTMIMTGLSGIDAFSGTALVRLDSCKIDAPANAAAVSIGPNARLVARDCAVNSGYIGFEVAGDRVDSITLCRVTNTSLYGVWWNGGNSVGDSADYSANNVISNVAATDLNVGFHVLQQSIESVGDSVKGGYNWDYNLNTFNTSGKTARISDATITGKSGDDWGLVLNGIGATSDSAFLSYANSNDLLSQANVYVRQIHAEIDHSRFVSSGGVGSPPYGILERDGTSGYVGCTWAKGQRTACVKREGSTSQLAWSSYVDGRAGNNTFYSTYAPAKLFANYGTDSVDARLNYWGSSSGPGSRLTGPVKYQPYNTRDNCNIEAAKVAAFEEATLPLVFTLEQNYPNPFNPATTIDFSLPTEQTVQLDVFNVLGRRVKSFDLGSVAAGVHSVRWNGTTDYGLPVGSGIYFYRLTTPLYTSTKKMMFLK